MASQQQWDCVPRENVLGLQRPEQWSHCKDEGNMIYVKKFFKFFLALQLLQAESTLKTALRQEVTLYTYKIHDQIISQENPLINQGKASHCNIITPQ